MYSPAGNSTHYEELIIFPNVTTMIFYAYNALLLVYLFICHLKSVVARALLNRIQEEAGYVPVYLNFSAQTSSIRTQEIIESKLEKKRKNILGKEI